MKRFIGMVCASLLLVAAMVTLPSHGQGLGTSLPAGYVAPSVTTVATSLTNAGLIASASTLTITVTGGSVNCNGSVNSVAPVTYTLLANTTYLIVYNCQRMAEYAKSAVTGPGTQTGQPGVPNSIVFPIAGVEIPIAQEVCTTTCTNTDKRSLANLSLGPTVGNHITAPIANSDASGVVTLSGGTFALTFNTAYTAAPVCVGTDQTAAAAVKIATTTTTATFTGTSTDVVAYACYGNPN